MNDVELQALSVFVAHETACLNADVTKYGEPQWNPTTPSFMRLGEELHRLGNLHPVGSQATPQETKS